VLALGLGDGTISLVDARTLRARSSFRVVPRGPVRTLAYVPRSRLLVVGGDDGFLALVDPRRETIVRPLRGHLGTLRSTSISADGRVMASAAGHGEDIRMWALPSGRAAARPLGKLAELSGDGEPALSPDGRTLAVLGPGLDIEIMDVPTGRRRASLPTPGQVLFGVRFTPDGRFLVGADGRGSVRLWSTATWRPAGRVLRGQSGSVYWQAVSPDSHTLATGSTDGMLRLFDLRSQRPVGAPLPGLPSRPMAPLFTPDGAFLFAISDAGRAYRWDVRPSAWARRACAVAGRTLTRAEWSDVLPDREYAPACTG
jgi:WD40 repeat protein